MRTITVVSVLAGALDLALSTPGHVFADSHNTESTSEEADSSDNGGWRFELGAGVGIAPDYEGSDNYDPVPLIAARVQKDHYFVRLQGTKLQANAFHHGCFASGLS